MKNLLSIRLVGGGYSTSGERYAKLEAEVGHNQTDVSCANHCQVSSKKHDVAKI